MPRKKRVLEEVDGNVTNSASTASTKRVKDKEATSVELPSAISNAEVDENFEFVAFARPFFDINAEMERDTLRYTNRPLKDFPGYQWAVSKKGKALLENYALQSMNRDRVTFRMTMPDDWSSRAEQEVAENMLVDFNTAFNKKDQCPYTLWASMEAVQLYLNVMDTTDTWSEIPDEQRLKSTVLLLAHALLATLAVLERENLFSVNSRIPNISLVVAMFFFWIVTSKIVTLHEPVFVMILKLMQKHNVEVTGLYMTLLVEKVVADAPLRKDTERKINSTMTSKDKFNYRKKYKEYVGEYGEPDIGGYRYDITKMPKAKRIKHHYGRGDPLDVIPLDDLPDASNVL